MKLRINPVDKVKGVITVPGDKSISHRSIILSALATGQSIVQGFLESEDCLNTVRAFQKLGVDIAKDDNNNYIVKGKGLDGLREPDDIIDCGNSGTTMRLLAGLLSAQRFNSILTGDNSLQKRPMGRITEPLRLMGAKIQARQNKYAPLKVKGSPLHGIKYDLPVASAQVKSSILLAGLYADGEVSITEPGDSRDHTERMLQACGVDLKIEDNTIRLPYQDNILLNARNIKVPGDISSAAFFIAAALIIPGSEVLLKNVGINPTRSGIIDIIEQMGGNLQFLNKREVSGEPVADIFVRYSKLKGTVIKGSIIPRLIDELPIIAVLASQAEGETIIKDAAELRVKETDRISTTVSELEKLGVEIEELKDGMVLNGPCQITGDMQLDSYGDHRLAMSLAIIGLLAENNIVIRNSQAINISFPGFVDLLKDIC